MIVGCGQCQMRYDDAERSTICPHYRFLTPEAQRRKDLAIELLGKTVRFKDGGAEGRIAMITWDGMVSLEHTGIAMYDPEIFEVVR